MITESFHTSLLLCTFSFFACVCVFVCVREHQHAHLLGCWQVVCNACALRLCSWQKFPYDEPWGRLDREREHGLRTWMSLWWNAAEHTVPAVALLTGISINKTKQYHTVITTSYEGDACGLHSRSCCSVLGRTCLWSICAGLSVWCGVWPSIRTLRSLWQAEG